MNESIDTKLMHLADNNSKISGTYYGSKFSGTAIKSRQNTLSYREEIFIELDNPIMKPGNYLDGGVIIIQAQGIEKRLHTIDGIL
jgi:hypothetical protein